MLCNLNSLLMILTEVSTFCKHTQPAAQLRPASRFRPGHPLVLSNFYFYTFDSIYQMAVDMVEEKVLTEREALLRIDAQKVADFFTREQREAATSTGGDGGNLQLFATGIAASQGLASGLIAFNSQECLQMVGKQRQRVILCLADSRSSDARAIRAADAIITLKGDVLSNAAILCRGMGKPCVSGLHKSAHLSVCADGRTMLTSTYSAASGSSTLRSGSVITVDGGDGKVYTGKVPTACFVADQSFQKILMWADKYRKMRILASISCNSQLLSNLGSPMLASPTAVPPTDLLEQVQMSFQLGADGIGCLCTDNLFCLNEEALKLTRRILMTAVANQQNPHGLIGSLGDMHTWLDALGEIQMRQLIAVFQSSALHGKGGTINVKLMDNALCSYLPSAENEAEIVAVAMQMNVSVADVKRASGNIKTIIWTAKFYLSP